MPVFGGHRQLDEYHDRPVRAQDRVRQLEERVRTGTQRIVELDPKAGQHAQRLTCEHLARDTHGQQPFFRNS